MEYQPAAACVAIQYRPGVTSHSLATLVHDTRIVVPLFSKHWCTGAYKLYEGLGIEYPRIGSSSVIAYLSEPAPAGLTLTRAD